MAPMSVVSHFLARRCRAAARIDAQNHGFDIVVFLRLVEQRRKAFGRAGRAVVLNGSRNIDDRNGGSVGELFFNRTHAEIREGMHCARARHSPNGKAEYDGEQNHAERNPGCHALFLRRGRGIRGLRRGSVVLLGVALLAAPGLGVLLSAGLPVRLLRLRLPIRLGLGKRLRLALSVRLALLRVKTLRRRRLRRLLRLLVRVVFGHGCAFPNVNVSHAWI